jgi:hypothetical protein
MEFINKLPYWFRWILYIPIPYLVARTAIIVSSISVKWTTGSNFSAEGSSIIYTVLYLITENTLTPALMGCIAYILAPKHKFIAGMIQMIVWCAFVLIVTGMFISSTISYGYSLFDWESIKTYIMAITSLIATCITAYQLWKQNNSEIVQF